MFFTKELYPKRIVFAEARILIAKPAKYETKSKKYTL